MTDKKSFAVWVSDNAVAADSLDPRAPLDDLELLREVVGGAQERPRCQIGPFFDAASCVEEGTQDVDGLVLCERHALEIKLEGQISCWDEMLSHIDLWSREAGRQDRTQIAELLDVERAKATFAIERAYEDLDLLRSESSRGEVTLGCGELFRRSSLPPRGARPLSRVLRHR